MMMMMMMMKENAVVNVLFIFKLYFNLMGFHFYGRCK